MSNIKIIDINLSTISGVLFATTFMIPYSGIISWFLLIPLLVAIKDKGPADALALGTLTGTVTNSLGFYWLIGTLSRFGGFPFPVSLVFLLILSAFTGLSFGIFSYLTTKFQLLNKRGIFSALAVASIWTSVEFLFPFLFPYTKYTTPTPCRGETMGTNICAALLGLRNRSHSLRFNDHGARSEGQQRRQALIGYDANVIK